MSNEIEIVLVGGSKDGTVTEGAMGLNSLQNIVLNEDFSGVEFVDRYVSTGVQDREGREVYAHVGRYDSEESQSFWESLDQDQVTAFIEAEKAERAEQLAAQEAEAAKAAEEAAATESAKEEKPEGVQDPETGEVKPEEEKPAEETAAEDA